jgi:hypothetical protein
VFIDPVLAILQGTGAFTTVEFFDAFFETPTAEQLASYHAVLVYRFPDFFYNADLLGDRLAAYHDQGGGVVVAMFANMLGSESEPEWLPYISYQIHWNI